jgi:hypothetical protein
MRIPTIIGFLELVKTHIDEVKRLLPHIRRARGEHLVKCLAVSFDGLRQEVWVSSLDDSCRCVSIHMYLNVFKSSLLHRF